MCATIAQNKTRPLMMHGTQFSDDEVRFRVWAPDHPSMQLVLVTAEGDVESKHKLTRGGNGYHTLEMSGLQAGQLYYYQIDGDERYYPDPASHYQPQGVHGPSQLVDHRSFRWTDDHWRGVKIDGQIDYEFHIGTFTPEGTWRAAIGKLPYLKELGVTLLQLMPVAAFPGNFGWGYDGVYWYAPTHLYGTPDDFRSFVDAAHQLDLGVILDVVYNHLGPCGNYTTAFSPHYFTTKHHTEWGDALNFDGPQCDPVRDFVTDNAAYWIREFHLDGLRLDATHAILDNSSEHVVAALTRSARAAAGKRSIVILSESESQDTCQVRRPEKGGYGIDALLNDDFHHACRVAATGERGGYYVDFLGSPQELVLAARHGYLYQGQWNSRQGKFRGSPARDVDAKHFVHFLQNHDQVANSARAVRTHLLTSPGRHRALTALLLLGPQTPMLFMGQEFSASSPFYYFADHETDLAPLVRKGRREFMDQFPRLASFVADYDLPDPADEQTYLSCKLDWDECARNESWLALHRDLIRLRRDDPMFSRQNMQAIDGAVIADEAFVLRWYDDHGCDDRLAIFNLGRDTDWFPIANPLIAPPEGRVWTLLWSSDDPQYGGPGTPRFGNKKWHAPGHAAVVFRSAAED